jgi:hypothetical protein
MCLKGTATEVGFTAQVSQRQANLYRVFPKAPAPPEQTEFVATDGTWAFPGLDAYAHYYVEIVSHFNVIAAPEHHFAVRAIVGPLVVPSSGAPVPVQVKPVQIEVLESRPMGGSLQLQVAAAQVFDPGNTDLIQNAGVAIGVGDASTNMPWLGEPDGGDGGVGGAYQAEFPLPTPAQSSYTVTVSHPSFGSAPTTWQVVADPPSFDGTITSPMSGTTVPVGRPDAGCGVDGGATGGGDLNVTWSEQPQADYETLQLFPSPASGATAAYSSQPKEFDETSDCIPGAKIQRPGSYILNVAYSKTNCPFTADGCVYSDAVAVAAITAQ